jgi:hypothetical protein
LPFRDGVFDLVIDRHEAFNASEVARVLAGGGVFLTQQVSDDYGDIHALLGLAPPCRAVLTLGVTSAQVRAAGLRLEEAAQGAGELRFADVGVLGWYLRQVPWAVPGFDLEAERERLLAVHERIRAEGPVRVRRHQFWLRAVRPG